MILLQENDSEYSCINKSRMQKAAAMDHFPSILLKNNNFHVCTICGYKVFSQAKDRLQFTYIIYNTLKQVLEIMYESSCYHLLNNEVGSHQIATPMVIEKDDLRFYNDDIFIVA